VCSSDLRWYHEADATKARRVLPFWAMPNVSDEQIAPLQKMFGDRQIGRLSVVGSNDVTAAVIEESYERFLSAFDAQLQNSRFLFGGRPASSDFGIMGRLDKPTRLFMAEMLGAFLSGDFKRAAEVHFEAGYVSADKSVDAFAQACRAIGEPILK